MSKTITPFSLSGNGTLEGLITIVNNAISFISTEALNVNTTANGALSTGNGFVNGIFGSLTLVATTIRGGNVQSSGNLTISTNTSFGGAWVNLGSGFLVSGNTKANTTQLTSDKLLVGGANGLSVNSTIITFKGIEYSSLSAGIVVANTTANIGTTGILTLIPGTNMTINTVANATSNSLEITFNATVNAIVGAVGSNTYIQFNNTGVANGSAGLIFNSTTNTLAVGNNVSVPRLILDESTIRSVSANVTAANTLTTVDSFTLTDFIGADYVVVVTDNAANNKSIAKLLILHDVGNAYISEYGLINSNSSIGTFSSQANSTHILIQYTTITSANVTVKLHRSMIDV